MKNKDLATFQTKQRSFVKELFFDSIKENYKQEISEKFTKTFPNLTQLIKSARIVNLTSKKETYRLYSWTDLDENSFGWLSKLEFLNYENKLFIDEHNLILETIGGIIKTYNDPEPSLSNNKKFLFLKSESRFGLQNWENYYKESLLYENKKEIDYNNLIAFSEEVNGNLTLYHIEKQNILLFAPDHSFNNVTKILDQPDYTFYKINCIKNFTDYVETFALEWINKLKNND